MDLSSIISAAESLLYQLAVWLILLPKTLCKVVAAPTWIPGYVEAELAKPDEDRFDDYVAPLLFFVLITIVPNLIANAYWPEVRYSDFATPRDAIEKAQTLSAEHRLLLYSLIWIALPLSFAFVHLRAQKRQLSGSELKPLLYGHCLRVAPLGPLFAVRFIIEKTLSPAGSQLIILNSATILLAFAWILYSDVRISTQVLKIAPGRAVLLALTSLAFYYLIISPVVLLSLH